MTAAPERDKKLYELLKKYWGYDAFRGTQLSAIHSVMAGSDTLVLMPTGAGKSITYQIPGMAKEGVCIVITPLIALMKDQVEGLRKRGIPAASIHSGQSTRNIDITLDNCVYGDVKFLYVAPERLSSDIFRARMQRMKVSLIAVDEAHCISQWGYDFRPSYLKIASIRSLAPDVPVIALTASATELVADDVMEKLGFREPNIVRGDYARPNLSFAVRHTDDKKGQLLRILENVKGQGIIYMRTREGTETLARELEDEGISVNYYHAGLPHAERALRQNDWTEGRKRVMIATTAFGMGIDKADVRFVVHYDLCSSPEEYYQEAGRAGRDGRRSYAVLMVGSDDKDRMSRRFASEFPDMETIKKIYVNVFNYLQIGVGDGKNFSFAFNVYDFCARYKVFAGTFHNAVKILQQNGYMVFTDEEENPARLMFCVSRDDLYSLRVQRDDLDNILRTILRLYTGVFSDYKPIDTQELAIYTGYTEERVRELLKTLWQLHVIRYIPKNRSPMLYLAEGRLPEKDIYISPQSYKLRKAMAAERIQSMFDYVDNISECRSAVLQRYFGQADAAPCGICDVCIDTKKHRAAEKEGLSEKILRMVNTEELSVKELVAKFDMRPESVIEVIDELMEERKISITKSGLIVAK